MTAFVERHNGAMRWLVRADLADALIAVLAQPLESVAERVKHSIYRSVYRLTVAGTALYLKHNRTHDARSFLRTLIRPSKARSEFDLACEIARRGVPTITPVAFGTAPQGETYLATLALSNVEPLGAFLMRAAVHWPEPRRTHFRQALAVTLGQFLATMHQAGVLHADLHPDNLLVNVDNAEGVALHLIDLTAVRLHKTLSARQQLDNLVLFNRWFSLRCERTDRLRFWHAYWDAWEGRSGNREESARNLETDTIASNAAFWRQLDRRSCQNNRRYRRLKGRTVTGHAVADLDPALLDLLRADPDAPFTLAGAKLLKNSPSSKVLDFTWPGSNGPQHLILKRFEVTKWFDPWVALVRRSPALRSWIQGHAVRLRWLPTPRPLAVLFRRRHGLEQQTYLLTEKIADAVELQEALRLALAPLPPVLGGEGTGAALLIWQPEAQARGSSGFPMPLSLALRAARTSDPLSPTLPPEYRGEGVTRALIDQVARLIRHLHERNLSHRDLKAANILTTVPVGQECPVAGTDPHLSKVWLIDLVGVRRHTKVSRARRIQNIARLNASFLDSPCLTRSDRLRFLRLYLQWGTHGRAGWKDWWKDIDRATQAKRRRNLSSGRPLA